MSCHIRQAESRPARALGLALLLAGLLGGAAHAADTTSPGETMARAMTRMMEVMGLLDDDATHRPAPAKTPDPRDFAHWPGLTGGDLSHWLVPFGDPIRAFGMPDEFAPDRLSFGIAKPQSRAAPRHGPHPDRIALVGGEISSDRDGGLDGVWEARDGGLLIISGGRFRLHQPSTGSLDGLVRHSEERIVLYNPANGQTQPYEYAELQGRLALRDARGQLFLYRRLWLDLPPPDFDAMERPGRRR